MIEVFRRKQDVLEARGVGRRFGSFQHAKAAPRAITSSEAYPYEVDSPPLLPQYRALVLAFRENFEIYNPVIILGSESVIDDPTHLLQCLAFSAQFVLP